MAFTQTTYVNADEIFESSFTRLGPVPDYASSVWESSISSLFYSSTRAGKLPVGSVITPFTGDQWNVATVMIAYQVQHLSGESVVLKKCFDAEHPVGLKAVLSPAGKVGKSSVPSASTSIPSGLADTNDVGEVALIAPFNITIGKNCHVFAFNKCAIDSIKDPANKNAFCNYLDPTGFVPFCEAAVVLPGIKSPEEQKFNVVVAEKKGPRQEIILTAINAFTALSFRNVQTTSDLLGHYTSVSADVIYACTSTLTLQMKDYSYVKDPALCMALLTGNWRQRSGPSSIKIKDTICLTDISSTGSKFACSSQLYSDLKKCASVIDAVFRRSLFAPLTTRNLFLSAEEALQGFCKELSPKTCLEFELVCWDRLLCCWGLFLRNAESISMPINQFIDEQAEIFNWSKVDLNQIKMAQLSKINELYFDQLQATADTLKRDRDDQSERIPKGGKPKDKSKKPKPDVPKPPGNLNSPNSMICMRNLGRLAGVDDRDGRPILVCNPNARCAKYFHGSPTGPRKEEAIAAAKKYFTNTDLLNRVLTFISTC